MKIYVNNVRNRIYRIPSELWTGWDRSHPSCPTRWWEEVCYAGYSEVYPRNMVKGVADSAMEGGEGEVLIAHVGEGTSRSWYEVITASPWRVCNLIHGDVTNFTKVEVEVADNPRHHWPTATVVEKRLRYAGVLAGSDQAYSFVCRLEREMEDPRNQWVNDGFDPVEAVARGAGHLWGFDVNLRYVIAKVLLAVGIVAESCPA